MTIEVREQQIMMKSNHFKRVENLIHLRVQIRRVTGVIEQIEESIRLWKSTDKIDEYWDNFWAEHDQRALELCIAILRTDMTLVPTLIWDMECGLYNVTSENMRNHTIGIQNEMVIPTLGRCAPQKKDIIRLQDVAREAQQQINRQLVNLWDRWRRRDSRISHEDVTLVSGELLFFEEELNDHWLWLTGDIERAYHQWNKMISDNAVVTAYQSDQPVGL
jgi:hypothetical protein